MPPAQPYWQIGPFQDAPGVFWQQLSPVLGAKPGGGHSADVPFPQQVQAFERQRQEDSK
jgi:hypothetical protein